MGGWKEGGDCWGEGKRIKEERAREGASGGKTRREELTHILIKITNFCKQQVRSYLLILDIFSLLTQARRVQPWQKRAQSKLVFNGGSCSVFNA